MADNVTLPATGTGTADVIVATDKIAGVDYQQVKLVDGTLDSTTVIVAGGGVEAGALRVTLASDSTGVVSVDDNGSALTVDGTVTANLSATDNAVLDTIDAAIDAINAKLVTGTVIGDVNLGATDNAVLDTIAASLSVLDDWDTSDTCKVTLQTGSAAIGKLAANSGVDIGDADITSVIPGVGATNLGKAEDAQHASGDTGVAVWGVRDDTLGIFSATEGDYEPFHMTAAGRLYTSATVDAALPAGTNAIGKLAANSGVDIGDVDILSIAAGNNNIGDVDIASGTVTTVTTLTGGGVAHDAADSGNPHKMGARVILAPGASTALAANDRTDLIADSDSALFVRTGCNLGECLTERISNTNGTATALSVFTTGAGVRNIITDIIGYNSSATAGYCDITDGSGGTILLTVPLPAGGGSVINLTTPIRSTANTALYYDVSGALTTVYLTFVGYRSKVA